MYLRNRRVGETWPNSHVHTHVIYVNVYQMFGSCFKHLFIYICKYILFFDTHLYIYIYLFVCVCLYLLYRDVLKYIHIPADICIYIFTYVCICIPWFIILDISTILQMFGDRSIRHLPSWQNNDLRLNCAVLRRSQLSKKGFLGRG